MRAPAFVLAALALAPAAHAATPVAGSGSLNDAPVLEPGEYSDTIPPGEQLFYGVRVEEGQKLAVTAHTSAGADAPPLRLRPLGPLREPVESPGQDGVRAVGPPAAEASSDPYLGPGTWYVSVQAMPGREESPPVADVPFTLVIQRTGGPKPAAAGTPRPAPPRPRVDDDVDPAAVGAAGMSGLLLGLLGGALARRRRRQVGL